MPLRRRQQELKDLGTLPLPSAHYSIAEDGDASNVVTSNVTFDATEDSITVRWNARLVTDTGESHEPVGLVRKISLREFATENVTELYVLEDFNSTTSSSRYYTLSHLQPGVAFVVCFETIVQQRDDDDNIQKDAPRAKKSLQESQPGEGGG
jgi:hypothetical protein